MKLDNQILYDAFKASPIGMAVENMEGQPLFVNPALCTMLGFTEEELRDKHCVQFSPPEDAEKDWTLFQQLVAGAIDHYQIDKRYFRKDGSLIWGRLSIALLNSRPSPLVVAMVEDISERRTAEDALRESEERLRLVADRFNLTMEAAGIGMWEFDLRSRQNLWLGKARAQLGMTSDEDSSSEAFWARVHPDDCAVLRNALQTAMLNHADFNHEFRIVWADGTVRWLHSMGRYYYTATGEAERMLGMSTDITDRKRAEEALSGMTRKLVEAQEQERTRIGRDLHDDISQRLAMLAIQLEQLERDPSEILSRLQELRKQAIEISRDVQALSHELHSAKLEYLGAVAGIRGWCREFGERQGVEIRFKCDVSNPLPIEIGLCLFRVVQEALHNALKHSGVKQIEVQLTQQSNDVHLSISDSGRGFNLETAMQSQGLGLTSMRERVRLVNGTIDIESKPTGGTNIRVCVPLAARSVQRAAG